MMRSILKSVTLFLTLFSAVITSPAQAHDLALHVSPILGYEFVNKNAPYPHTHGRLVYGAIVTAGIPLVSLEGEYTHGTDSEVFTSPYNLATTDISDRYRVGIRSEYSFAALISAHLRGGAEAIQNQHQEYQSGVQTINRQDQTMYHPYAGAGAAFTLTNKIQVTFDVVATIPNINDLTQNEYETSAGLNIHFP